MNKTVLIIGDNKQNNLIYDYFEKKSDYPVIIEDVYALRSLDGQIWDFTANTKADAFRADFVILTRQPAAKPVAAGGLQTFNIYENAKAALKSKPDRAEPIVFLLDCVDESPMSAAVGALKQAEKLASGKHPVYYFAKFIRTAGSGVEELYRDARQAGVTFVKYETLCLTGDEDTGKFTIKASDGVFDVEIQSKSVFADGGTEVDCAFAHAVKSLKLETDEYGYLPEEKYFLSSAETSRRGVYYISRDIFASNLEETLRQITATAQGYAWDYPLSGIAVVDGEKCVLCLNCIRACTHAALTPDKAARQMKVLDWACDGCGSCVSVCPGNAIDFESKAVVETLITNSVIPRKNNEEKSGKILALCCENSAAIAMEKALLMLGEKAAMFKTVSVPCGGLINSEDITIILNLYSKVLSAVCMDGACRHYSGDKRACKQTEAVKNMLETAGILPDSVHFTRTSHAMPGVLYDELIELIKDC